ncbi:MAG: N-acetyltransferase [Paludibacter sp.]|jgi:GNAT superfamily N-acetyltransferase|nr:N-acetyltransferase [Paludibacter sp.]
MLDLQKDCELIELSQSDIIENFNCGDADLNDFFNIDAILYQEQMLGQTFFFRHNVSRKIVCAFTLSPDSLNTSLLPNNRSKKVRENISHRKPLKSFPAYLIGRLGVSVEFENQGIGSQLLKIIRFFCLDKFRFYCRFIVVDAYNKPEILNFYQKNDFQTVFSTEQQERDYKKLETDAPLRTRYMFYDMINWKNKQTL